MTRKIPPRFERGPDDKEGQPRGAHRRMIAEASEGAGRRAERLGRLLAGHPARIAA
jgi:hypothetical protein